MLYKSLVKPLQIFGIWMHMIYKDFGMTLVYGIKNLMLVYQSSWYMDVNGIQAVYLCVPPDWFLNIWRHPNSRAQGVEAVYQKLMLSSVGDAPSTMGVVPWVMVVPNHHLQVVTSTQQFQPHVSSQRAAVGATRLPGHHH